MSESSDAAMLFRICSKIEIKEVKMSRIETEYRMKASGALYVDREIRGFGGMRDNRRIISIVDRKADPSD